MKTKTYLYRTLLTLLLLAAAPALSMDAGTPEADTPQLLAQAKGTGEEAKSAGGALFRLAMQVKLGAEYVDALTGVSGGAGAGARGAGDALYEIARQGKLEE